MESLSLLYYSGEDINVESMRSISKSFSLNKPEGIDESINGLGTYVVKHVKDDNSVSYRIYIHKNVDNKDVWYKLQSIRVDSNGVVYSDYNVVNYFYSMSNLPKELGDLINVIGHYLYY